MTRTAIEIVGVVAVILSLVFVGIELRNNTEAVKADNHYSLLDLSFTQQLVILEDPELSAILSKVLSGDTSSLTTEQQFRGNLMREQLFNMWEVSFYNARSRQLEAEITIALDNYYQRLLTTSTVEWWNDNSASYGESFQLHVNSIIEDGGA